MPLGGKRSALDHPTVNGEEEGGKVIKWKGGMISIRRLQVHKNLAIPI